MCTKISPWLLALLTLIGCGEEDIAYVPKPKQPPAFAMSGSSSVIVGMFPDDGALRITFNRPLNKASVDFEDWAYIQPVNVAGIPEVSAKEAQRLNGRVAVSIASDGVSLQLRLVKTALRPDLNGYKIMVRPPLIQAADGTYLSDVNVADQEARTIKVAPFSAFFAGAGKTSGRYLRTEWDGKTNRCVPGSNPGSSVTSDFNFFSRVFFRCGVDPRAFPNDTALLGLVVDVEGSGLLNGDPSQFVGTVDGQPATARFY